MRTYLIFAKLILFVITLPINAYSEEGDTLKVQEYSVYKEFESLTDHFELEQIIPLEVPFERQLMIIKMQLVQDRIYIQALNDQNTLLIYDLDGQLMQSVNLIESDSHGPIPIAKNGVCLTTRIKDFDVYDDELSILDNHRNKIITYDLDGNYKNEIDLSNEYEFSFFVKLDSGQFLIQLNPSIGEVGHALARLDENGKIIEKYLADTAPHFDFNLSYNHVFFRSENGAIRFIPSYGNVIYSYEDGYVTPFIEVNTKSRLATRTQFLAYEQNLGAPVINGMYGLSFYSETNSLVRFHYFVSDNSLQVNLNRKGEELIQVQKRHFKDDFFNNMLDSRAIYSHGTMSVHSIDHWNAREFFTSKLVQNYPFSSEAKMRVGQLNDETYNSVLIILKEKALASADR